MCSSDLELFLITYSGTYKGVTATVEEGRLKVVFPDLAGETIIKKQTKSG